MKNQQVASSFINNKVANTTAFSTNGKTAHSYAMLIACWHNDICYVVNIDDSPSKTTSTHINMIVRECPAKMLKRVNIAELARIANS